ncbi:MAG TPA: hypothetical protein VG816_15390 [Solirubrobacterales bacterium]|nr:hypothetical protein [Solirubrobacterales bacterium]
MKLRIGIVVAFGLLSGALMYVDAHEYLDDGVMLGLMGFGLITGIVVGRTWSLLALLGPLVSLGYLQVIGFRELDHDGVDPLLSPPGIGKLVWLGLVILIGIAIRAGWDRWTDRKRAIAH